MGFNSIVVRLKEDETGVSEVFVSVFQFHSGSIKRYESEFGRRGVALVSIP